MVCRAEVTSSLPPSPSFIELSEGSQPRATHQGHIALHTLCGSNQLTETRSIRKCERLLLLRLPRSSRAPHTTPPTTFANISSRHEHGKTCLENTKNTKKLKVQLYKKQTIDIDALQWYEFGSKNCSVVPLFF